jgi:hypothetical protein
MTPREKFRQDRSLTRGYNDLIGGTQMQAALDAAELELDRLVVTTGDVSAAAAHRWRREGANWFRQILENLNASIIPLTTKNTGALDHKA